MDNLARVDVSQLGSTAHLANLGSVADSISSRRASDRQFWSRLLRISSFAWQNRAFISGAAQAAISHLRSRGNYQALKMSRKRFSPNRGLGSPPSKRSRITNPFAEPQSVNVFALGPSAPSRSRSRRHGPTISMRSYRGQHLTRYRRKRWQSRGYRPPTNIRHWRSSFNRRLRYRRRY